MQAGAVTKPRVGKRSRCVKTPPGRRGKPDREAAYRVIVGEGDGAPLETGSPVHPDLAGPVDENICDGRVSQQRFERTGAHKFRP
jgi:hypothetical protein